MGNSISINQKKDIVIIKIAENSEHQKIIKELKTKLNDLKKIYQDEKTPIQVSGKMLKNEEIEEIQEIIEEALNVVVNFDSPKELGLHGIKKAYEREISVSDTQYIRGSLRSGQKIEYEGSVVIIGDVNGGSEIIATDNIVVIGVLRGIAHAGAKGNRKAIISAAEIDAPQLRIADVIKSIEKDEQKYRYAYIDSENIILE